MTDVLVIDAEGLDRLSCSAKTDPSTGKKTLKAKTVCESGFRNMTYVRDLAPMLVGEPPRCWVTTRRPTPRRRLWRPWDRASRWACWPTPPTVA
ncbi:hypothetical protein I546_5553 [Mycobacterium kansasii 732]|nr:hypothetical protein I546_5553 [Mycobacterium kansasii 732]